VVRVICCEDAVTFAAFLRSKAFFLGVVTLTVATTAMLSSYVFKVALPFVLLMVSILVLGALLALVPEYIVKSRYYRDLNERLSNLDKKHLLVAVLEYPEFEEGRILYETLEIMGKSMNDEIFRYSSATQEYREYIELWVHEIKTPIAGMKLLGEKKHDKDLLAELDRIDFLVEQVLFYARSNTVEKDYQIRRTNLETMVNNVLKSNARHLIAHKVRVQKTDLDLDVSTDTKWTTFILRQLIDNSIKYGASNLCFTAERRGDSVVLSVDDDGIGIEEGDLERVFEKGFTGENGRHFGKATGLGLYLCRKLCDKMGLGISAHSTAGEGTVMKVVFPYRDPFL
jgi:signal transduction histidine kinase